MLNAPFPTESLFVSFDSPETEYVDDFYEIEVIASAFQQVFEDRRLQQNLPSQHAALGLIRNYAVTQGGLGNTEARLAYFEAQRRANTCLTVGRITLQDSVVYLPEEHLVLV